MTDFRTYRRRTHSFFDELASMLVEFSGFNAAIESFRNSSSTLIPLSPNHTLTLPGRSICASWRSFDLMHGVCRNVWPAELTIAFTEAAPPRESSGVELQNDGQVKMVVHIVGSAFLKFYENNVSVMKARYPGGPKTWSPAWRFGWLIRNAVAHGDRFAISDPTLPPVSWNGLTVSTADNDARWFDVTRYVGGGDVLLLMDNMHVELGLESSGEG